MAFKLSRFTILYGCYIILSAAFMQQLRSALIDSVGEEVVRIAFKVFCAFLFLAVITWSLRKHLSFVRTGILLLLFALAFFLMSRQPYFSEKTHVITYGFLGFLACRDYLKSSTKKWTAFFVLCLFVTTISAADELFQRFLPYRVGDLRDVLTNVLAGFLGILIGCTVTFRNRSRKT